MGGIIAWHFPSARTPQTGTENTIGVASVDDAVSKVQSAGGKVIRPKSAVPDVGWLAYCEDTEGNRFGIMQSDPEAR
jgi:predicted enzyme related to lactoylglutathione lyase